MTIVTGTDPLPGELSRGPLGRATVSLQRYGAISLGFTIASLPAVAATVLLPPSGLTLGLIVLLGVSVAVALSASLAAWRAERTAVHPAAWSAFWRGCRRNALDVVRAVAPGLLLVTVIAVTVLNADGAGIGGAYAGVLLGIAGVTTLIGVRVTVLASVFSFRTRDLWRLAAYTLFRVPRSTVALLAMAICAVGLVWLTNEAVLLLLGGAAARLLLHHEQPVIDHVRHHFTHEGQEAAP